MRVFTVLKNSGFNENAKYIPSPLKHQTQKRQIIWFNPPYSANVKTNVGKIFMRLFDKHFQDHHKYYELFNRNNIKLSYSCMPNMNDVCRKLTDGNCLSECLIYKASASTTTNKYDYRTCENTFKECYNHQKCSFRH